MHWVSVWVFEATSGWREWVNPSGNWPYDVLDLSGYDGGRIELRFSYEANYDHWFARPQCELDESCRPAGLGADMGCYEYGSSADTDGDLLTDADEALVT